jgi:hypothetical protein
VPSGVEDGVILDKQCLNGDKMDLDICDNSAVNNVPEATINGMNLENRSYSPSKNSTNSPSEDSTSSPPKDSTCSPPKNSTSSPLKNSTCSPTKDSTYIPPRFLLGGGASEEQLLEAKKTIEYLGIHVCKIYIHISIYTYAYIYVYVYRYTYRFIYANPYIFRGDSFLAS